MSVKQQFENAFANLVNFQKNSYKSKSVFKRMILLNTVSCFVPNISDLNNAQQTETLLYGKEDLDNINNTSILEDTINYLIETKRFYAQLF